MAEQAEKVIAIGMFRRLVAPWADLILPGTSYLERDGTYVNLEGRLQRIRRDGDPAGTRRGRGALAPRGAVRRRALAAPRPGLRRGLRDLLRRPALRRGRRAGRPSRACPHEPGPLGTRCQTLRHVSEGPGLRLVTYRALFSGPAVERVPELDFQRPAAEVELSRDDARRLGIANGQTVNVRSNGTSLELRARLTRELTPGVARIADEHAAGLEGRVEVSA